MNEETRYPSKRVVIMPDIIARSFFDPECHRILRCWRDGRFRILVTRDLLRRYIRLLSLFGIPEPIIKKWILWFTHPDKARFIESDDSQTDKIVISAENTGSAQETPRQFLDRLESYAGLSNTDSN